MIIGVDIGGTKTLIARFRSDGSFDKEVSFATPQDYDAFIVELATHFKSFADTAVSQCVVGVPGLLDRASGIVHSLGNLPWIEKPVGPDIANIMGLSRVYIENDSKLAGLSEVRSLSIAPERALYLTISTGIGGALLVSGDLSEDMIDMELGKTPLLFEGSMQHWEDFASGRAFAEAYAHKGDDVSDPLIWQDYLQERLGPGLVVACSYLQIDTIIFGGGLGHHSAQFAPYLAPYLDERLHSIVVRPQHFKSAKHGKNAVIYGCFEYAKSLSH